VPPSIRPESCSSGPPSARPAAGLVSRKSVEVGQVIQPGQLLLSLATLDDIWVVANFKETQLSGMKAGQRAEVTVDAFGGHTFDGRIDSISAATGALFSLLPPDNATGNFVKVVQRIPVKILLDPTEHTRSRTASRHVSHGYGISAVTMADSPSTTAAADQARATAAFQETVSSTRWFILIGLITAAVMEVLDSTIVNVALAQMAGNLGATREEVAWVSTSYILANVVVLPMTAFFTEVLGRKRYLTLSIVIFIVSSMLCGVSTSLGQLVLWRLVQGAGGAALLSTAQATLRQTFPREEQGIVQSIFLLGVIVAPTLGPTLGGWNHRQRELALVLLHQPAHRAGLGISGRDLSPRSPTLKRHTGPIDWMGIVLLIIGIGSLQYVLEEGNSKDWFESRLLVTLSFISASR
jgi:hypothetical protein